MDVVEASESRKRLVVLCHMRMVKRQQARGSRTLQCSRQCPPRPTLFSQFAIKCMCLECKPQDGRVPKRLCCRPARSLACSLGPYSPFVQRGGEGCVTLNLICIKAIG